MCRRRLHDQSSIHRLKKILRCRSNRKEAKKILKYVNFFSFPFFAQTERKTFYTFSLPLSLFEDGAQARKMHLVFRAQRIILVFLWDYMLSLNNNKVIEI